MPCSPPDADPQNQDRTLAFLFIDLNHFKEINDSFGHPAGDELLRQLGPRLKGSLRNSDLLVRLGGDEFGVVLMDADADLRRDRRRAAVSDEPRGAVRRSTRCGRGSARASASPSCPATRPTRRGLLRCADVAMYRAKLGGKPLRVLRRGPRRRRQPPAPRRGAARGDRRAAVRAALPAAARPAHRRDLGGRGARALAAPAARATSRRSSSCRSPRRPG